MKRFLKAYRRREKGATLIDYALIAALIAIASIGGFKLAGNSLSDVFGDVSSKLNEAIPGTAEPDPPPLVPQRPGGDRGNRI